MDISLECREKLSLDDRALSHSIKTKLANLSNDAAQTIIDCVETLGYKWDALEWEDVSFFYDATERRRTQAISAFTRCFCAMVDLYVKKYRESVVVKMKSNPIDYVNVMSGARSDSNNTFSVDWITFLHHTRCTICYCRFATMRPTMDRPNRLPIALCSVSDKHIVCYDCCKGLSRCPLCNGSIVNNASVAQTIVDQIALAEHLVIYGGVRLPQYGIGVVMEYINGPSLATALTDNSTVIRNLSYQQRLEIALGICKGLAELHLAQIVHRDFKPENVLLSQSSDGHYIPKIVDFGVSFQLAIASATCVKESAGTVGYDAPEITIDNKTPTIASDIYALGFTLYELLTAKRIFTGLRPTQILAKFTMKAERPNNWPHETAEFLKDAIEHAWSVKSDQRISIGGMIHAIRKSLNRNQLSCVEMLREANKSRRKIIEIKMEDFKSFELFLLNEFVKRMFIDDCEAMQMFIEQLELVQVG